MSTPAPAPAPGATSTPLLDAPARHGALTPGRDTDTFASDSPLGADGTPPADTALGAEEIETLVVDHLPIASSTVAAMLTKVPGWVRQDDLYAAAVVGLFEAAQRFDPTHGVPFGAFARPRVRGAVLDELRRGDWAPRSVRRAVRDEQAAAAAMATELGRTPTDDELATRVGVSVDDLRQARHDATTAWTAPFVVGEHDGATMASQAGPPRTATPEDVLLDRETHGYLHDAIAQLSPRRAEVVRRYYLEGEEMRSIAEEWGVTVSRISQIAAEAVGVLRDGLGPLLDMAPAPATAPPATGARSRPGLDQYRSQVQAASTFTERLSTPVPRHDTA